MNIEKFMNILREIKKLVYSRYITKKEKSRVLKLQIISIIGMNIAYYFAVGELFGYKGFMCTYNIKRIIFGSVVLLITLGIGRIINKPFFFTVWNIMFIYFMAGEVIYYQYNPDASCIQIIAIFFCLLFIAILSKINLKSKHDLSIKNNDKLLGVFGVIMFIPFFVMYIKHINIKNLLFEDVYVTRTIFGSTGNMYSGYMMAPLSRIILPVLISMKLEKKQYKMALIYSSMVVFLFLCGALKSTLIGLFALLFFYRGGYQQKTELFLKATSILLYGGTILYKFFGNTFLVDALIRRVFFTPACLGNIYYQIFKVNWTYYAHSPFGLGLNENIYGGSITQYVGKLTGSNSNYSVGLITEGIFSLGLFGGILAGLVISLVIFYFGIIDIDKRYFGIIFTYIYVMNTALLSYALLTHGLMFLIVFSYLLVSKNEKINININIKRTRLLLR